ncbi:hypothetical protein ACQVTX_23410 [Bacillus pretiosus]|uniref:hypothetical protein n=1 Tax=Bacillus pretiosus TaxID=2983392 RepID=UPI003D65F2B5
MKSKKRMFIPSNFTVAPNTTVTFKGCTLRNRQGFEWLEVNCFKDHFAGNEVLEDWEIWIEDSAVEFLDKIEAYTGVQPERLV